MSFHLRGARGDKLIVYQVLVLQGKGRHLNCGKLHQKLFPVKGFNTCHSALTVFALWTYTSISALRRVGMGRVIPTSQRTTVHRGDPSAQASKTRRAPSSHPCFLICIGRRGRTIKGCMPRLMPRRKPANPTSVFFSRLAPRAMPPYAPVVCPSILTHRYRMYPLPHTCTVSMSLWMYLW